MGREFPGLEFFTIQLGSLFGQPHGVKFAALMKTRRSCVSSRSLSIEPLCQGRAMFRGEAVAVEPESIQSFPSRECLGHPRIFPGGEKLAPWSWLDSLAQSLSLPPRN